MMMMPVMRIPFRKPNKMVNVNPEVGVMKTLRSDLTSTDPA